MAQKSPSRFRSRTVQVSLVVLVVVAGLLTLALTRKKAPKFFTATAGRGTIVSMVQATGTVNALKTVSVGSQISGIISKLYVDFNSQVKKGELIAQVDPTVYENQLTAAEANLAGAQASAQSAQATVGVEIGDIAAAKASVAQAQATADEAKLDRDRALPLFKQGIYSTQQRDQAVNTYNADAAAVRTAEANETVAEAQLKASEAALLQAKAAVVMQEASVKVAQTNLTYCNIYAPVDGIVVNRAVDIGQTVAASFQTPTLFTIAQDISKMEVDTEVDESDVGRLKEGDTATFTVDAFPNDIFHGVIYQVRLNSTTVQNVVEYDVVIHFDNPGDRVFPSMTAYVDIPAATARNQLEVPNAALRFKPDLKPAELRALLAKYGMQSPGQPGAKSGTAQLAQNGANRGNAAEDPGGAARFGGGQGRPGGFGGAGMHPGQGGNNPAMTFHPSTAIIWKLGPDNAMIPVRVRTGITDFTNTAVTRVIAGELQPGDKVITGMVVTRNSGSGPHMMGGFR